MVRLSDLLKGGSREPGPEREGERPSRTLTEAIRRATTPGAAPAETAPAGSPRPERKAPEPPSASAAAPRKRERAGEPDAAETLFQNAVERIREILAVRAEAPLSVSQAEEVLDVLLQSLETSDALLVPIFRGGEEILSPARKAVNVCILSVKIGTELGYTRQELRELGLAALLADIGTALVPPQTLGKRGAFTSEERAALEEKHGEGLRFLEKLLPEHRWLGEVVRKRYERAEGPPEPQDRLEEYAAIIHLADIYKSLIHPRPARDRVGPFDALKEILQRHRANFPDRILKALIRAMSTFPVGSLVRLNTGEVGRVVARNKDFPLRPVIEVLVRRGKRLDEPVRVDLSQSPLLHIKETEVEEALP